MPELRLDPLSGLRTIVAGERAGRPGGEFKVEPRPPVDPDGDPVPRRATRTGRRPRCTRSVPDGGAPDTPGWLVRVVPNLYPALGDGETGSSGRPTRSPRAAASPSSSPRGPPSARTR